MLHKLLTTPPTTTPPTATPPEEEPCTKKEERSSHGPTIASSKVRGHGQSPYWIAKAYVTPDGKELTAAQRKDLQRQLGRAGNKQVQVRENGHIGYKYKNEITLSDGTKVNLADNAADRIGTGQMKKTRTVFKNGKEVRQIRKVLCEPDKNGNPIPVDGPEGQWQDVK